jgi:hypothetical protein
VVAKFFTREKAALLKEKGYVSRFQILCLEFTDTWAGSWLLYWYKATSIAFWYNIRTFFLLQPYVRTFQAVCSYFPHNCVTATAEEKSTATIFCVFGRIRVNRQLTTV